MDHALYPIKRPIRPAAEIWSERHASLAFPALADFGRLLSQL
jgi:hypothetical protein